MLCLASLGSSRVGARDIAIRYSCRVIWKRCIGASPKCNMLPFFFFFISLLYSLGVSVWLPDVYMNLALTDQLYPI